MIPDDYLRSLKFQDVFVFFIVLITLAIYLKIPNRVFQIKLAHAVSRTHLTFAHYIRSDRITSRYNNVYIFYSPK